MKIIKIKKPRDCPVLFHSLIDGFYYCSKICGLQCRLKDFPDVCPLESDVSAEPSAQADNSVSPKLPMRFEVYKYLGCSINDNDSFAVNQYRKIVDTVYDFIKRQLSAV